MEFSQSPPPKKGQQGTLVVNNAGIQRLSSQELKQARADLEALFESDATLAVSAKDIEDIQLAPELAALLEQAQLETLEDEQAEELQELLDQLGDALAEARRPQSQNFRKSCPTSFITPPMHGRHSP